MYLVAVQDNRPDEMMAMMREAGLRAEVRCRASWIDRFEPRPGALGCWYLFMY